MKEFILLMAYLTALVALSIDAMLPALGVMGGDLGVTHPNHVQFVIGSIFIGMTIGQLIYGPVADAIGRKPTLYFGLGLYIIGCLISWHAENLPLMLAGRVLQGIGVGAPRIVTVAIVRDKFSGRDMAYVMSMIMGVFIMVPAVAPTLGMGIIHVAGWRAIFLFYIVAAVLGMLWATFRLKETLHKEYRRPFSLTLIWQGAKEVVHTRVTLGYTIASGTVFGALIGYLTSSQQIFQEIYEAGDMFGVYFGIIALCIGAAFFTNSALVRRFGMRFITWRSVWTLFAVSCLFLIYTLITPPPLLAFMLFAGVSFFCLGLTFGNMNAMAMEPMGHMAGLASAFIGACSSLVSLTLGSFIGQMYDGTVLPITLGFVGLSFITLFIMRWTERTEAALPTPAQ